LATLKGLPSAYDKDLQEDKAPVIAACDALEVMLPVLAGTIATLTVHAERMAAALDASLLATELADYLVMKGLPFREAHHLVGQAIQLGPLNTLSAEALAAVSPAFGPDVVQVWDFAAAVERRAVLGGTAVGSVRAQVEAGRKVASDG
jgi:argininosuccinate lyase